MAQSGYTPILIYASSTPGALPSAANLTSSASGAELAINYADGKLYFKNSSGVVTLLAGSSSGPAGGSNTQVQYNSSGVLAGSSNLTFDGTSLTLGGNPTLSAGTANGVLYLNGSKVATSGSALTFDGTNLGVGVSSPSAPVDIQSNSGGTGIRVIGRASANAGAIRYFANDNTTQRARIESNDTGLEINSVANLPMYFNINNTEQMRLTSTGLGIGTSSPGAKLTVSDTTSAAATAIATFVGQGNYSMGIQSVTNSASTVGNRFNFIIGSSGGEFSWSNNGGTLAYLDSSGNLGLGVTPSAWGTSGSARSIQVQLAALSFRGAGNTDSALTHGAYYNGTNWIYQDTNVGAARYQMTGANGGSTHSWSVAAGGTAGNAITFTQAMTLDASGNLGVGTTSPAQRLDVRGTTSATIRVGSTGNGGSGDEFGNLEFYWADPDAAEVKAKIYAKNVGNVGPGGGGAADLLFATRPAFGSLDERARITSDGDLLVGTTTSNGRLTVQGSGTGSTNAFYVSNSTPAAAFRIQNDGYINTGTLAVSPYNNTTGSAANLFVDSGGGISRSTSSLKYKTDVKNAEHGLAEVMQLRSVTYKGKNDGNTVFGGLIAEEVHSAGLTEFVQYAPDGSPDALAYGNMVSLCIKAIQEQQALITSLTARVALLEGN